MELIAAFFSYPLKDQMKIWDGTKLSVFYSPKKTTVDITKTSNSEHYLVDTNGEKDQNYQLSTTDSEEMIKLKIKLSQLNNHLVLYHKRSQIYFTYSFKKRSSFSKCSSTC